METAFLTKNILAVEMLPYSSDLLYHFGHRTSGGWRWRGYLSSPQLSEEEVPQIKILDFPQSNIAIAISTISSLLLLHPTWCNVLPKPVPLFICQCVDITIKGFLISDLLYGTMFESIWKIKIGRHILETICLTLKVNVFWLYRFFLCYFYNTYNNSFKNRV